MDEELPIDKYSFMRVFAPGVDSTRTGSGDDVVCIDDDGGDGECNAYSPRTSVMEEEEVLAASVDCGQKSGSFDDKCERNVVRECSGEDSGRVVVSAGNEQSDCDLPTGQVSTTSDDDEAKDDGSLNFRSPCPSSDHAGNGGSLNEMDSLDCSIASTEPKDVNVAVIVSPDYVLYGDKVHGESRLIFSSDCIRIECSDESGSSGTFVSEWAVADLLLIDCSWSQSVETALVEVRTKSNNVTRNKVCDTSGVVRLVFTVFGTQWLIREEKIMSLDPRYKDIWKVVPDAKMAVLPGDFVGLNASFSRSYHIDFEGSCEDIVYPKGDPDAVSISMRDVELLKPGIFVNDTIIDFYIQYLRNNIKSMETDRFHFFNSFFFRKLADLDKDPGSALEAREAFLRVRKWTRKLNIFEKDYIFIPVNFNLHWSLLVICHPGEITNSKEEEINESLKVPCILHMDSIRGSHKGLKNLIQRYLWEEWRDRHPESSEDIMLNFSNLRFVPLELPQQENSFDCGLFLLHYVELFLKEAPANFSPFNITEFSKFLNTDWFIPAEASFKRFVIRDLLYKLFRKQSQNDHLFSCSDVLQPSGFIGNYIEKEPAIELLTNQCSATVTSLGDSSEVLDREVELKRLARISPDAVQCDRDDELVDWKLLDRRVNAESTLGRPEFWFQQDASWKPGCTMSPILEDAEQLVSPETEKDGFRPPNGTATICSTSYAFEDVEALETPTTLTRLGQVGRNEGENSPSDTWNLGSQNSPNRILFETGISGGNDTHLESEDVVDCNLNKDPKNLRPVSTENSGHNPEISGASSENVLEACIVEDSLEDTNNHTNPNQTKEAKKQETVSVENTNSGHNPEISGASPSENMLETCIVEDSQEDDSNHHMNPNQMKETKKQETVPVENKGIPDNPVESTLGEMHGDEKLQPMDNGITNDGDNKTDSEDLVILSVVQPRKRRNYLYPNIGRRQTRSCTRKSCS